MNRLRPWWLRMFRWRMLVFMLLLLVALLPQCVSLRMSDRQIDRYFADKPVKPAFGVVSTGGRPVHFAQLGAGTLPMVLFIHGSPGSWDAFIDFFADSTLYSRAKLVAVDRPGFGKSALGEPERSLQQQAAAIAPLLRPDQAGQKPILVGHSLGGPVAVRLAMDYPDRVGGLILVAPSIDPDLEKQEWYRPIGNVFPVRQWLPAELDVSNQEIMALKAELLAMKPLWATISVPVIVIQGEADSLVPPGNAAFAKRMLINAPVTIQLIPNMNHFIPWRRPDLIRDAIRRQLTAAGTAGSIQSTH